MDRRLVAGHRLGRSLAVVVVAVALAAVAGLVAGPTQAWTEYAHGGIDPAECSICHPDDHTTSDRPVTNERCMACHSYAIPDPSLTCWTCHTPGQDMGGARNDDACTAVVSPRGRDDDHARGAPGPRRDLHECHR